VSPRGVDRGVDVRREDGRKRCGSTPALTGSHGTLRQGLASRLGSLALVVVRVHAPEFAIGKSDVNIDRGIRDHGVTYPITIDNQFALWRAVAHGRVAGQIPLAVERGRARAAHPRARGTRLRPSRKNWSTAGSARDEINTAIRHILVAGSAGSGRGSHWLLTAA
jgi:hypothetical protein